MMSVVIDETVGGAARLRAGPGFIRDEGYLTKKELAQRLKKTGRTVERWQRRGYFPVVRVGHSVLYRWSEVVQCLQQVARNSAGRKTPRLRPPRKSKSPRAK